MVPCVGPQCVIGVFPDHFGDLFKVNVCLDSVKSGFNMSLHMIEWF